MRIEFAADDYKLLTYATYDDYLDALIRPQDQRFLRRRVWCRAIAELGYTSRDALTRVQFERRKLALHDHLHPVRKVHHLASTGCTPSDPLLIELMHRERANRTNLLKTIIFLRQFTTTGKEVSGYIDFADSLLRHAHGEDGQIDWHDIFAEKQLIIIGPMDLCYYDWHSGRSIGNDTPNFRMVTKPDAGLIFFCRFDRRIIYIDPRLDQPGISTMRITIKSPNYEQVVLFDHVPRSKY